MLRKFNFPMLISILCIAGGIFCIVAYFTYVWKPAVDMGSISDGRMRGETVCYSDHLIVLDSYAENTQNGYNYFLASFVDEKGDVTAVSFSPEKGSEIYEYCLAYCKDGQAIGDCVVRGYFLASGDRSEFDNMRDLYFEQACKAYGMEGEWIDLDYIGENSQEYHFKLAVKYIFALIAGAGMAGGGISLLHRVQEMYGYGKRTGR